MLLLWPKLKNQAACSKRCMTSSADQVKSSKHYSGADFKVKAGERAVASCWPAFLGARSCTVQNFFHGARGNAFSIEATADDEKGRRKG